MAPTTPLGRALVTGASSGIGAVFADRLASNGYDLVLVARRLDRLEALAARLQRDFGRRVDVIAVDLTDASGLAEVERRIAGDESLSLLVNNAGFSGYHPFATLEPGIIDKLIDIHIRAMTRLARAALPAMVRRGAGGIINMASLLALSGTLPPKPLPHRAVYAGAKSYLLTFTQALAGELVGTGVKVQVCLPGVVDTEFHIVNQFDTSQVVAKKISPQDVVTASLAALARGEVVCVPALADGTMLDGLADVQRTVLRAGAMQSSTLAERYRQPS